MVLKPAEKQKEINVDITIKMWYNYNKQKEDVICVAKKYSVKDTTRVEREKIANDALATKCCRRRLHSIRCRYERSVFI